MLHQVGDLFELNVKLRCQKVKELNVGDETVKSIMGIEITSKIFN
jgi:hypothetical protein